MKIIKLTLKNLNSLVGQWQIDFTNPAFQDTGIFAITGSTGAGKTTILDAICLALYGQTPRLNKITNSSNDIMSRTKSDCLAEVVIDVHGQYYQCSWSQRRAHGKVDGNLQATQHSISLLPSPHAKEGKIIEDSASKTKEKIAELLCMDFKQFTRSILLAQGSFSAFLQANHDERAVILEQITGTEIYADISKRVYLKKKEKNDELKKLQDALNGIQILSDTQLNDLNHKLNTLNNQQASLKAQITTINQQKDWLKEKNKLQQQQAEQDKQLHDAQIKRQSFEPDAKRLQKANRAAVIEGTFFQLGQLEQEHSEQLKRQNTLQKQLSDQNQHLTDLDEQVNNHTDNLQSLKNTLTQQQPLFKKIRKFDQQIEHQQQQLSEQKKQRQQLSDEIERQQQNNNQSQQLLNQTKTEIVQLKNDLAQYEHQDLPTLRHQLIEQDKALTYVLQTREALITEQQDIQKQQHDLNEQNNQLQIQNQHIHQQQPLNDQQKAQLQQRTQALITDTQTITGITLSSLSADPNLDDDYQLLKTTLTTALKQIVNALNQSKEQIQQHQSTNSKQHHQQLQQYWQQLIDNQTSLQQQQHTLDKQQIEEQQLKQKLHQSEQRIQELQTILALHDKIHQLQNHIATLSDNEPCPLCGSTEHPYLKDLANGSHPHYQTNDQQIQSIQAKQAELNQLLSQQSNQQNDLSNMQQQLAIIHAQQTDKIKQHITLLNKTQQHIQQLLTPYDNGLLIDDKIDALKPTIKYNITLLQQQTQGFNNQSFNNQDFNNTHNAQQTSKLLDNNLNTLQQLIDDIATALNQIQNTQQIQLNNIQALLVAQSTLSEDINQHFDAMVYHDKQIQQLENQKQNIQAETRRLSDFQQRWQKDMTTFVQQAQQHCQQIIKLLTNIEPIPNSLMHLSNSLNRLNANSINNTVALASFKQTDWQTLSSNDLLQPLKNIAHDWKQRIDHYKQTEQQLQHKTNQEHSLTATLTAQNSQLDIYQQQQKELDQTISNQQTQLQELQQERHNKFGHQDPDEAETKLQENIHQQDIQLKSNQREQQKQQLRLQDLQSQLTELKRNIDKKFSQINDLHTQFNQELAQQGFSDSTDFIHARLPRTELEQLQNQQQNLDNRIHQLHSVHANLKSQLVDLQQQVTQNADSQFLQQFTQYTKDALSNAIDEFNAQLTQLNTQFEEQQKQLGNYEQTLAHHEHNLAKTQKQQALIKQQQQETELWEKLHELIGQADGKKYRNFAQGLTFDIMINEANHQLRKMSDRYLLYRDESVNALELSVIDLYQNSDVRTSKNLSGGESFILSLALALGLSSMASQNLPMNSLFLDEGFGTLDEDSLEVALNTLTNLHQEGKLIGVISHIQSLKDRILTQIQVTKLNGGVSKLSGAGVSRHK